MTFQKSPFPFVFLFIAIMSVTVFFNFSVDTTINQPIVHTIEKPAVTTYQITKEETKQNRSTIASNY